MNRLCITLVGLVFASAGCATSFTYKPYAAHPSRTTANIRQSRIDVVNPKMEAYYKNRNLHTQLIEENRAVLVEKTRELLQAIWQDADQQPPLHIVLEYDFKSTWLGFDVGKPELPVLLDIASLGLLPGANELLLTVHASRTGSPCEVSVHGGKIHRYHLVFFPAESIFGLLILGPRGDWPEPVFASRFHPMHFEMLADLLAEAQRRLEEQCPVETTESTPPGALDHAP